MSATEWHLKSVFRDVGMILGKRFPSFQNMHKFLKDTANSSKPSDGTWDFFNDLRGLRNVLVHHAGFVPGDKYEDKVKGFIEAAPTLELDSGFVKVTAVFCRFTQDRIERFFEELHEEYVKLCCRLEVVRWSCSRGAHAGPSACGISGAGDAAGRSPAGSSGQKVPLAPASLQFYFGNVGKGATSGAAASAHRPGGTAGDTAGGSSPRGPGHPF